MFSPNKTSDVYEKTSPRFDLRWKPTGRIFKSVGLRWIPTGKLFDSCTSKDESEPTLGLNVDFSNIHESKQTLDLSAGTSINVQKEQSLDLSADNSDIEDDFDGPSECNATTFPSLQDSYKDGDASFQLKSDSLPHAHAQTTKTYYKYQDLRIKKAQVLKTKTSTNSDKQDLLLRYQVYQGRLLKRFQEDAKLSFMKFWVKKVDDINFEKIDSPFQQTSSLKSYVPTVILENIINDLEDEVVSLLEKEKENLEIIESLKSKRFESSENVIYESENQSENDCQVVEKGCDNLENSKVIALGILYASYDVNDLFVFDDVSIRNSQVRKMPFRKKPRNSLNVRSKSNSNNSLPKILFRWLPKMQLLAEPVAKWIPKIVQIYLWIIDSGCSKHMTGNRALLTNFVEKFLGTVRFGNNDFAVIAGYGDYTIALNDIASNSLACLLEKASSSQSWLWHQRVSHLNFATINDLMKNNLVRGLPKMKFKKDHFCFACEQGKIHRKNHKSKTAFALNKPLYLLHMDLCGLMRVKSINEKRYVLVVVDDYSWYTWVFFLCSKDEASENKTLAKFFDDVGITQQFSAARTPQQNGVMERRNRTLVEAVRTMLTFANLPLLVPSCCVIFDLEPLSLYLDFIFTSEIFKSLSFSLDRLCHLAILCHDQHTHTLHLLEISLIISLDRLDILKEDLFEYEHVVMNPTSDGMRHLHLYLYMNPEIKQLAIKLVDEYGFVIRPDLVRLTSGSIGPF
ncbi:retrovirus-related pol polyprotein from transposon TNT 1-94 [Tanacetum coccineum]